MKILFLYPNLRGMNMLPPSIAILSSLLKQRGHTIDMFDTTHWHIPDNDFDSDKEKEKNLQARPFDFAEHQVTIHETDVFEDFQKKVQSFSPDLIAISATEDLFPIAISLLRSLRDRPRTVLGGVFATFAGELALSYPEIDMVCVGEGENCIVDLCERMEKGQSYDNVTNLWLKKGHGHAGALRRTQTSDGLVGLSLRRSDDGIIKNSISKPVRMEDAPLPDIGIFEDARLYRPMAGKVYRMLPVETHRGCPYTCAFCNSPSQEALYEKETNVAFFRKKDFESVRKEILYYRDVWNAEYLYFWADTFFAYTNKEFDQFCDMYQDIGLPFWCQTRVETLTTYRVQRLKDVGLHRVALGLEHGNEKFRREVVDRRMTNDLIVRNMKILNDVGVPYSVNNIIGFPTETYDLAWETMTLNRRIDADNHNCYSFSPFHGTPLRDMAEKLGYLAPEQITRCLTRDSILDMPQFPRSRVEGLRRTFVMYVKFPESRWPEIKQAEAMTPEGDAVWLRLRDEFASSFFKPAEGDHGTGKPMAVAVA